MSSTWGNGVTGRGGLRDTRGVHWGSLRSDWVQESSSVPECGGKYAVGGPRLPPLLTHSSIPLLLLTLPYVVLWLVTLPCLNPWLLVPLGSFFPLPAPICTSPSSPSVPVHLIWRNLVLPELATCWVNFHKNGKNISLIPTWVVPKLQELTPSTEARES